MAPGLAAAASPRAGAGRGCGPCGGVRPRVPSGRSQGAPLARRAPAARGVEGVPLLAAASAAGAHTGEQRGMGVRCGRWAVSVREERGTGGGAPLAAPSLRAAPRVPAARYDALR